MRWYAVYTKPYAEHRAALRLRNQGFDAVFMPCYRKIRRHARREDVVTAPLFPRYLFLRMDVATTQWRAVHSTIGVVHIVSNADTPLAIPDNVIEALQTRCDDHGFVAVDRPGFRKGDVVHIEDGAFADCEGLFECVTDDERVTLLLDILGRQVRVQAPLRSLRRAF